jgi:hypothetical protein
MAIRSLRIVAPSMGTGWLLFARLILWATRNRR